MNIWSTPVVQSGLHVIYRLLYEGLIWRTRIWWRTHSSKTWPPVGMVWKKSTGILVEFLWNHDLARTFFLWNFCSHWNIFYRSFFPLEFRAKIWQNQETRLCIWLIPSPGWAYTEKHQSVHSCVAKCHSLIYNTQTVKTLIKLDKDI